jgi:hypothetical protein
MGELAEFLKDKKLKADRDQVDWDRTKSDWLEALADLYRDIREWLSESEKRGLVRLADTKETLEEEHLGTYEAPGLNISFGADLVRLVPVGRLVLGARGRVDVITNRGQFVLVLRGDSQWYLVRDRLNKDAFIALDEGSFTAFVKEILE